MGEKSRSKGGCCGWFIAFVILALVVGAIVFTVKKKFSHSGSDKPAPVPGPPGAVDQKYSTALKTAMQFFDVQKCINSLTFSSFTSFSVLFISIFHNVAQYIFIKAFILFPLKYGMLML